MSINNYLRNDLDWI